MRPVPSPATRDPAYVWAGLTLLLASAAIIAALAFEHLGGYVPCPLCLEQRYAYYLGIPLTFAALVLIGAEQPRLAALILGLAMLAFLANTALGVYHAGVEWRWWPGPDTCAGGLQPLSTGAGGLLGELARTRVIRCDEAPWRFAGLSFAGWNAVISLLLTMLAAQAVTSALQRTAK